MERLLKMNAMGWALAWINEALLFARELRVRLLAMHAGLVVKNCLEHNRSASNFEITFVAPDTNLTPKGGQKRTWQSSYRTSCIPWFKDTNVATSNVMKDVTWCA